MTEKVIYKNILRGVFNMNVKKTIASIAAIAMVASATSLAPLFTGTSISADELETIGAETPETTDPNAGIDLQAMPDISGAAVANLEGATGTATYADKTLTINLTKGESSTVSGTGHPTLNDGNSSNRSGYQNGAFKVTVNGNFSGYEMLTKSPDSDGTKYISPTTEAKVQQILVPAVLFFTLMQMQFLLMPRQKK